MRLTFAPQVSAVRSPADPGADAEQLPPVLAELLGSWSATRWQYRLRSEPDRAVDLVCDQGRTLTLSLSAQRFILSASVGEVEQLTADGVYRVEGEELAFTWAATGEPERVRFRLGAQELSLSSEASAWDFDGDGEMEPAGFVAVLVRL